MPQVRIPLRQADADVPLDLQTIVDQAYQNGRYDDIDYKERLDPPLDGDDVNWVEQLLQQPTKS